MRLRDVAAVLIGRRQAILSLAGDRRALPVSAILVLSAALAREYDGVDLLHEPWHLAIPFVASAAVAGLIYSLVSLGAWRRSAGAPRWPRGFVPFLALFWVTAPLAWLYAIPYERFCSPEVAMTLNLLTLGVVATWRVVLLIRYVQVIYDAQPYTAAVLVLVVADAVLAASVVVAPVPVIHIMGGVRLSAAEAVLQGTALWVGVGTYLTLPAWLLATAYALLFKNPAWTYRVIPIPHEPLSRALVAALIAATVAWLPLLWWAQPEQMLRRRAERALLAGDIAPALALMSNHPADDFPPSWDPPPRIAYARPRPPLIDVVAVLSQGAYAPWVEDLYLEKLNVSVDSGLMNYFQIDKAELEQLTEIVARWPKAAAVMRRYSGTLVSKYQYDHTPPEEREAIKRLLTALGKEVPEAAPDKSPGDSAP